jgi:hypothetical protein
VTDEVKTPKADGEAIARLKNELAEARARNDKLEAKVADQRDRLEALGKGREETMRALADAREEIKRLKLERDELKTQLARIDDMQVATIALPDEPVVAEDPPDVPLPSIEELMTGLGDMEQAVANTAARGHLHVKVQAPDEDSGEMLPRDVVFPEQYAATADTGTARGLDVTRLLVLLDGEKPIKYPLYKDEMTIGRADDADIRVGSGFISRVHARLRVMKKAVVVEDVASKNGIQVNSKVARRHTLHHGDVLAIGPLRFRFIDMANDDA